MTERCLQGRKYQEKRKLEIAFSEGEKIKMPVFDRGGNIGSRLRESEYL